MPAMVGLMHSSRSSTDIPLASIDDEQGVDGTDGILPEVLKAYTRGTGGMLESIANMANSILGAGIIGMLAHPSVSCILHPSR